jgi:hypothetical protein
MAKVNENNKVELKRVMVRSISTDAFFNEGENKISQVLMGLRLHKTNLKKYIKNKNEKKIIETNESINRLIVEASEILKVDSDDIDRLIELLGVKLKAEIQIKPIDKEIEGFVTRSLRREHFIVYSKLKEKEVNKSSSVVALFESTLTRTLKLSETEVNDELIIVKAYHYRVLEDLITNGFTYDNHEYVFFSSSSGQMKKKKCVFVRKDLWERHEGTFTCGLTWDRINETKIKDGYGINTNKYLAYLSLLNTNTTPFEKFDINQVVIVPDLELKVEGTVEFINHETYQIDKPERIAVPMNVSDGVGMCLPEISDKAFQIRTVWTKGLIVPFNFKLFAKTEANGNYTITDVWGDTHHIINDNVKILLSASQMKTWRYYRSMKEFRQLFKENNCEAGKTNEEVDTRDITLSYQHLQSLTDMKEKDLVSIAEMTNSDIKTLGRDLNVMLRSIGATEENDKKDYLQKSIMMYNNLLNDPYVKEMIKSKKKSMVEDAKAGKLKVEGRRVFVIPDLYGYCQFLFTGVKVPVGLLGDGEVFGNKIPSGKVTVMRSPSLYRELGIRENIKNKELKKWFTTGGLFVSNHDLLGRLLQMDFDGDQVNVSWNKTLLEVSEKAMENIYPLYYEMGSAPVQTLDKKTIYTNLIKSFSGSIGSISNSITKIWNSAGEFTEDKLIKIKLLTAYNNYMIDACKTNNLPKPSNKVKKEIGQYTKGAMPYFFKFDKYRGKDEYSVEDKVVKQTEKAVNENGEEYEKVVYEHVPVVNMLDDVIKNPKMTFRTVAEKLDYTMLMSVKRIKSRGNVLDEVIKETFGAINKNKKWMLDKESDDYKEDKYIYIAKVIKDDIMETVRAMDEKVTEGYVVNVLVHYLYKEKNAENKKTLYESFGDIVYANLKFNLHNLKDCQCCGEEFKAETHKEKYCSDECSSKMNSVLTVENAKNKKELEKV